MAGIPVRSELDRLDDRIELAWQMLISARLEAERNPNSHRQRDAEQAEAEMNRLLEKRHMMVTVEKMVKA